MNLRELNSRAVEKSEELLRGLSVFIGYWFVAKSIVRLIDKSGFSWWENLVMPILLRDLEFGVFMLYLVLPLGIGVIGFIAYRPKSKLVRWMMAPAGFMVSLIAA
ncbi:hypothetical protein [Alcanivorax sp.]|uniref:hypothetical protein n=1 Tax=Alcanivorax sp. TaxID=1872427 RepID=UPI00260B23AB|nr:hypothetical protein [Alcanivorax sp.]